MEKLIETVSGELLCGMGITVSFADGSAVSPALVSLDEDKNIWVYADESLERAAIRAEYDDGSVIFSVELKAKKPLASGSSLKLMLDIDYMDAALESRHDTPWWMMCGFPKKTSELSAQVQNLILKRGAICYGATMLCGEQFKCEADASGIALSTGCGGTELDGAFLAVTASTDPLLAVEFNYTAAKKLGAVHVPLRAERSYPEIFESFGWCSWNAFYQDVTSAKLYSKLDEMKEKGLPFKWIIIDDGWSPVRDGKLTGFDADKVKFPEGLGECIRRIKEEYGVRYVGVWHAFNGYWEGVDPESELASDFADALMTTKNGQLVPSDDPDKAFRFWDAWHSHLADCGIDFVKVDNQSSSANYLWDTVPTAAGTRHAHEAIERSINKNFGGCVINCMGMDLQNVLARPSTAVSRNSDDFYPDRENGFAKHIKQNVYSAIWHSQIMHCDFDMWWSGKSAPVESGVLRAISGGPVYVSDKVGESELSNILPVCGQDGDICRLDNAAMPTYDCVFTDCETEGKLLKVFNRSGEALALAVFNISREPINESFELSVIPGISEENDYIAYEYFTKSFTRVNFASDVTLWLAAGEVRCYSLYPITYPDPTTDEGAYIMLGDTSRYVSIGSREKKQTQIDTLV